MGQPEKVASGSLYKFCWEYARDAMFVADVKTGLLVDCNPAAESLLGYSRQEMIGRHFTTIHPADEVEVIKDAFQKASVHTAFFEGFHLLAKDGRRIPVEVSATEPFEQDGRLLNAGVFCDATNRLNSEHRLAVKRWALSAYAGAASALLGARCSESMLQEICKSITSQSGYVLSYVGFAENQPGKPIQIVAAEGEDRVLGYLDKLNMSWSEEEPGGQGPAGMAVRTNQVQIMEDSETSEIFLPWREKARKVGIRSSVTVPFHFEDSRCGLLSVYANHPHAFEPIPVEVFQHIAEEIGVGLTTLNQNRLLQEEQLHREKAQRELLEALTAAVSALTTTMEMRDPYTAGHQVRVAEIACAIAAEMGWEEPKIQGLRMAGLLHDIGKISIPTEILVKPSPLTKAEFGIIKQHPEVGYSILKTIPFAWPIADTVRQHHEKLDGSGYPQGLKGDEILPGARILAVADIVESMASDRPYRPTLGLEIALAEVENLAGRALDREVVRICVSLFREKGFKMPEQPRS